MYLAQCQRCGVYYLATGARRRNTPPLNINRKHGARKHGGQIKALLKRSIFLSKPLILGIGASKVLPRKGQIGSALMGSLQNSCFFYRGTFLALPLTCLYIPKSARLYLLSQSVRIFLDNHSY